jgi:GT2 family glycosyltransferase
MNKPCVYAIIVNWNNAKDTVSCLDSLSKIHPGNVRLTVLVVDNGSSDNSVSLIRASNPNILLLPQTQNLGFTGGNNIGIKYALRSKTDYVWLLNNDTLVDASALSFINAFSDPSVGAVGSKIYFAAGHEFHTHKYTRSQRGKVLWYAGGVIDWENMYASHRGVDEVDIGKYDLAQDTQFITGCSFAFRSAVAEKIGLLDENYYLYLEDVDYSLRIKKCGYRLLYYPKSVIWHLNAKSSGRPGNRIHEYYLTRNRLYTGLKYAPNRTKISLIREGIRNIIQGPAIRRQAVIDAFTGRFGRQYETENNTN